MTFGFGAIFETFSFLAGALLPAASPSLFPVTTFAFEPLEDVGSGSETAALPAESSGMFS